MAFTINQCIGIFVKFFCLLTPFFVLGMFIAMTAEMEAAKRAKVARKTTLAILILCLSIYFLGKPIFAMFGITLDAFRIGAGAILFMTAAGIVLDKGKAGGSTSQPEPAEGDISVVPLAIPFAVGPGTTGAIMVMSAENQTFTEHLMSCIGLAVAIFCIGVILILGTRLERLVGPSGIRVLSKLTGLILAALAAQLIFTGIKNFLSI